MTRQKLERWVKRLMDAEYNYSNLLSLVNKADEYEPTKSFVPKIMARATLLRITYQMALATMEKGNYWSNCCQAAMSEFHRMHGPETKIVATHWRTIQVWNIQFRNNERFPHPNPYVQRGRTPCPLLFEAFPEAQRIFQCWASKNLERMSCEMAATFIRDELVPKIYNMELADHATEDSEDLPTLTEFKSQLKLRTVAVSTAARFLAYAGLKFSDTKKSYYTDRHEDPDNVAHRKQFIEDYFKIEKLAHRWIQIPIEEAVKLENGDGCDSSSEKLMKNVWAFEFVDPVTNKPMREYHIDCFPEGFAKYVKEENKPFGANLSHRFPPNRRPVIIVGQDEAVFKQWSFSKKSWHDHKGSGTLLPKDEGHSLMLSAFVSRAWSFCVEKETNLLSRDMIQRINCLRRDSVLGRDKYLSTESAIKVIGGDDKRIRQITDASPFCTYFDVGSNGDGYWTYDHMAVQFEDLVDCLVNIFPDFDFAFLFDHSSGHARKQKDGLNEKNMNFEWGGVAPHMHETVVPHVGPFAHADRLEPGAKQRMVYTDEDSGPYAYKNTPLTDAQRESMKFDCATGEKKICKLSKKELVAQMLRHDLEQGTGGDHLNTYQSKSTAQLQVMSQAKQLPTQVQQDVVAQGWLGQPKGLFQVLWECGFIDPANLDKYVRDKRKAWMDATGELKDDCMEEYQKYSLLYLMGCCDDFKHELSALEQLAKDLSARFDRRIDVHTTTKYHCELAGEGIEYGWGLAKRVFRSMTKAEKSNKDKFVQCVRKSVAKVLLKTMRKFSAKARRYMLVYFLFDRHGADADFESNGLSYEEIEKYVNQTMKTHRCTLDQEHTYIQQAWKEAQQAEP